MPKASGIRNSSIVHLLSQRGTGTPVSCPYAGQSCQTAAGSQPCTRHREAFSLLTFPPFLTPRKRRGRDRTEFRHQVPRMARKRAQSGGPLPLSAGPLKAALPKYMALYRRRTISGLNFPRGIKRAHDQSCSKSAGLIMNWNDLTPTSQKG